MFTAVTTNVSTPSPPWYSASFSETSRSQLPIDRSAEDCTVVSQRGSAAGMPGTRRDARSRRAVGRGRPHAAVPHEGDPAAVGRPRGEFALRNVVPARAVGRDGLDLRRRAERPAREEELRRVGRPVGVRVRRLIRGVRLAGDEAERARRRVDGADHRPPVGIGCRDADLAAVRRPDRLEDVRDERADLARPLPGSPPRARSSGGGDAEERDLRAVRRPRRTGGGIRVGHHLLAGAVDVRDVQP